MQFTELGKPDGKTLLLLPGTACTWQLNFKNVLDELSEKYAVLKGDEEDIPKGLKEKLIGFHAYRNGFEALIRTDDLSGIPASLDYEKASIDEILVYIAKEDKNGRHS